MTPFAGALHTPWLLMLSGIGPGEHLRKHGIAVQLDRPGVGSNLMDHPGQLSWALAGKPVEDFPNVEPLAKVALTKQLKVDTPDSAPTEDSEGKAAPQAPKVPAPPPPAAQPPVVTPLPDKSVDKPPISAP